MVDHTPALANSKIVTSNRQGLHENLDKVVLKHLRHTFKKPIAEHSQQAFDSIAKRVDDHRGPLVFDSCCGIGESTAKLAERHGDALVIGVDQSAHRLDKHSLHFDSRDNAILLRADCVDFWRLALSAGWRPSHHYLLYPNPWPKAHHLQRRWYAHAVFPALLALGGQLECRSNWLLYLQEFERSLALVDTPATIRALDAAAPLTPFERKYSQSGQQIWQLKAALLDDYSSLLG
ncbi:tRNA (guanine-N(7)-)-methyltransferase [Sinobacterium norvegicum]|uniref:tRNA (guanine(46)-N(7))-methyltransferase n=1 Tax=Sinobacterium norvegicum TaxID=1641715 RepID=A0ABM9AFB2_9GAMM|nr:tRNA (guanine-N(7)-)-methyltransferase [Sinobacterium norvegicum]CAH0991889.1 tRNA (guanine-N(7)-)-methyltransferase [Sinobacterium norvegicum]